MEIEFRVIAEQPSMAAAYLLCLFLGLFGAHRYYLGERRTATAMLILSLTLVGLPISAAWVVVDFFLIPVIIRDHNDELRQRLREEAMAEG